MVLYLWNATVRTLIPRSAATSFMTLPRAINRTTSAARGVTAVAPAIVARGASLRSRGPQLPARRGAQNPAGRAEGRGERDRASRLAGHDDDPGVPGRRPEGAGLLDAARQQEREARDDHVGAETSHRRPQRLEIRDGPHDPELVLEQASETVPEEGLLLGEQDASSGLGCLAQVAVLRGVKGPVVGPHRRRKSSHGPRGALSVSCQPSPVARAPRAADRAGATVVGSSSRVGCASSRLPRRAFRVGRVRRGDR